MAEAANAFLDNLDEEQRSIANWHFPADEERLRWYYTPTDHGGLPLSKMRPGQQQLAFKLLAAGLSRPAYVTACTIVGLENVLDQLEGWSVRWERERGRDPGLYYVRVFGRPGGLQPWSWRFGGHHLSVHHVVVGGQVRASTPLFLGADPAVSPLLGGGELRPLGGTEDLGREFLASLGKAERELAIVASVAPFDLVSANRSKVADGDVPLRLPEIWRGRFEDATGELVETLQEKLEAGLQIKSEHLEAVRFSLAPKGIRAEGLSGTQRDLLRQVVAAYVERLPDELARPRWRSSQTTHSEGLPSPGLAASNEECHTTTAFRDRDFSLNTTMRSEPAITLTASGVTPTATSAWMSSASTNYKMFAVSPHSARRRLI